MLLDNKTFLFANLKGMSCQFCSKYFSRGYNLHRLERKQRKQERNMYQTDSDSQDRNFQDDISNTVTQKTGSLPTEQSDSESEEESDLGHR